jgi:hypothetical protein
MRRTLLKGFKPISYALYELAYNDPEAYLPDTAFRAAARLNGPDALEVLQDKRRFYETLNGALPLPRVLAEVSKGRLEAVAEPGCTSAEGLLAYLRDHTSVILKPRRGQKGRGVFALTLTEAGLMWDTTLLPRAQLGEALGALDGYLVTERVAHAPYADVFPDTVNSVRMVVVQDQALGLAPFSPVAVQRFGASGTGVTDNAARGGLYAQIDPATGVLSEAVRLAASFRNPNAYFAHHPETGAPIAGVQVPRWVAVQRALLALSAQRPTFRYIGWDVVVTRDGFSVLEANVAPSLAVQVFYPYLKDPRLKRFFRAHNVV